ncbi:MAG: septation protein A [Alcaligenaceae bacterium]|nr:septation protein A [Alcaligenaceae bacterium]
MKKFLFDFFPLVLFFVAFKLADIYIATWVAIAASVAQIIWLKIRNRPIEATNWMNVIIIVVFGGATIYFQNEAFVKWKPTVLYWMFAVILLGGKFIFKKNLIQKMLGAQMAMENHVWDKLNYSWSGFFIIAGAINLFIAFSGYFTLDQWATFKVFGMTILLIVFAIGQSLWISRYIDLPEKN